MGQESGTVVGCSDKSAKDFKLGFDEELDMSFCVGSFEIFKCDRLGGLSLVV